MRQKPPEFDELLELEFDELFELELDELLELEFEELLELEFDELFELELDELLELEFEELFPANCRYFAGAACSKDEAACAVRRMLVMPLVSAGSAEVACDAACAPPARPRASAMAEPIVMRDFMTFSVLRLVCPYNQENGRSRE